MNEFSILHISDVHFGPYYLPHVGEALLRAAEELSPDMVVASGDFTQRAKPQEFADAAAFLEALPSVPRIVTPGNHDVPLYRVWERLFDPYRYYREYISDELNTVAEFEHAVFVSLNSSAPHSAITNGWISSEQLDFAAEALRRIDPAKARIVVAHHHFAPAPDYDRGAIMPKARRALDRFGQLKVDMILGGHLHRAYIGNSLDVYAGGNREHGIIIVQSGTSTSRRGRAREREKNSFNLLYVTDTEVLISHYMYFHDLGRFAPFSRHRFPRVKQRILEDAREPTWG